MFERSSQWKKRKLIFNSVKFTKKEENQSSKCVLTVSLLLSVKKLKCFIILKSKNLKKQFSEIEVRAPISYLYEKMPHTRKKRRNSNVKNVKNASLKRHHHRQPPHLLHLGFVCLKSHYLHHH